MTAGVAKSAVARPPRRNVRGGTAAFTLIEMLVTVAALTLVASIVAPCVPRAFATSRSAGCMNNLHHLSALLHTETDESLGLPGGPVTTIPGASRWTDFVVHNRLERLMLCPADDAPHDVLACLRHVYIRQDGGAYSLQTGVRHADLADLLAGRDVPDKQAYYNFRGQTNGSCLARLREPVPGVPGAWRTVRQRVGWQWVYDLNGGQPPDDDQAMVAIDTCAAFLITLTEPWIEIRPLGHHPQWRSASRHWVCKGNPYDADEWQADVLVRLTGVDYDVVNPPVRIYAGRTSYGMSNLVGSRHYRLDQVWLMGYTHDMVDMTPASGDLPFDGNRTNGEVLARHGGRTNVLAVGGDVSCVSPVQLAGRLSRAAGLAMGR